MAIIPTAENAQFTFLIDGQEQDDLLVLGFTGREEISRLSEFSVQLAVSDPALDLKSLLHRRAALRVDHDPNPIYFHGLVFEAAQQGSLDDRWLISVKLVPRVWLTSLNVRNDIYLDLSVPEIIETVLIDNGLAAGKDFELAAAKSNASRYPKNEYTVQYAESDFNFLSRLMEKVGLFYFFRHEDDHEKLVIADDVGAYTPIPHPGGGAFHQRTETGLEAEEAVLTDFQGVARIVPKKVILKDYNYRKDQVDLLKERPVGVEPSVGTQYEYGDHYKTQAEGDWLAQVRAQELACQQERFGGTSNIRSFEPAGKFQFKVSLTSNSPLDGEYTLVSVRHHGNQEEAVLAQSGGGDAPTYGNSFEAIRSDVQYRSPRSTPIPRVTGMFTGTVDSAGGDYADIDDEGRYAVKIHFDLSDRRQASATKRIRMMQPYGGSGHGMHLPLQMNTEVALVCMDGDPDRPMIAGVLPNPSTQSQVTGSNSSQNVIRSVTGNSLVLDDKRKEEKVSINATKDYSLTVANNATETISNKRDTTVKSNDTLSVTEGVLCISVKKPGAKAAPGADITMLGGSADINVASKKNVKVTAESKNVEIGAAEEISLTCGASSLVLKKDGTIVLSGKKLQVVGSDEVVVGVGSQSSKYDKAKLTHSGAAITSAASGTHEITGLLVKIN